MFVRKVQRRQSEPTNGSSLPPTESHPLTLETPYQLALIITLIEAIAVFVLAPRELSGGMVLKAAHTPAAFEVVAGMRMVGLIALAMIIRSSPWPHALVALAFWATLTLPPELWAGAIEGRMFNALTMIGTFIYSLGIWALTQLTRLWPVLLVGAVICVAMPPTLNPYAQLIQGPDGARIPWFLVLCAVFILLAWRRWSGDRG